jgi:hypothetical protein
MECGMEMVMQKIPMRIAVAKLLKDCYFWCAVIRMENVQKCVQKVPLFFGQ